MTTLFRLCTKLLPHTPVSVFVFEILTSESDLRLCGNSGEQPNMQTLDVVSDIERRNVFGAHGAWAACDKPLPDS